MPILVLKRLSDRMPDFTTVSPGDRIKLSEDLRVEVISIESSKSMTVRTLDRDERFGFEEDENREENEIERARLRAMEEARLFDPYSRV
jgi:hypothetical protein